VVKSVLIGSLLFLFSFGQGLEDSLPLVQIKRNGTDPIKVGDVVVLEFETSDGEVNQLDAVLEEDESLIDLGWFWISGPKSLSSRHYTFELSPLTSGSVSVPRFVLKDLDAHSIGITQSLQLSVVKPEGMEPASGEKKEQANVKSYFPLLRLKLPKWVVLFSGGFGFLLVSFLVFLILKFLKRKKVSQEDLPKESLDALLSEHEQALKALLNLEKKGYLKNKNFKKHYFKVSEILKNYLGRRYGFDGVESTSSEIINMIKKRGIEGKTLSEIIYIFDSLDLVKFTDHVPSYQDGVNIVNRTQSLIQNTQRERKVEDEI
tara:strand:- start:4373 stop:5326 length:954 start_codon:yes stop_codon:yes gene_type:complete